MSAKRLSGKVAADNFKSLIKEEVNVRLKKGYSKPHLAAILVGNNPASSAYVAGKVRDCNEVGFKSTLIHLDGNISEIELLDHINQLNNNDEVHGFIVQLPLPKGIDEKNIVLSINPLKDVDGFHPENMGRMALGLDTYLPATPYGIKLLLEFYNIETSGKNVVVIGRSHIVGLPMSILLGQNSQGGNATVTLTHSKTKDLERVVKNGDIIIAAIGKASFVNADFIKKGAVVIDVGINKIDGKLKGDVDFESISDTASAITPVPGGVGLMTRVGLLMNTLKAANENK
tara:strand:+ start:1551 stop:2411 length:861 start_codon:yes stop_codon:yes gene_type:complete